VHRDYLPAIEQAFTQVEKDGKSVYFTGTIFQQQVSPTDCYSLIINPVNQFIKGQSDELFILIAKDITRQKSLQDSIYKSEQEKTLILNSLNELIVFQNKNSEIIWANQVALENAGLSAKEIVGKHCYDIWGNKQNVCEHCSVRQTMLTGKPHEFEHMSPDGRNWIIKGAPVHSQQGEIIGAVEITREITLLKHKERQLRLTQFSIDHFTEPVYWIAADGSIVYSNEAASHLLGYSKAEFAKLYIYDINASLSPSSWHAFWIQFNKSGFYHIITEQKKKDNHLVQVEITMHYFQFEGEEYCFAVVKDLTAHKLAEAERQRLEEQLYQANRLETIGQISASIAHDFNNLLTSIRTYSQLLLTSADNQIALQDDIREIQRAIDHGSGLIQQLLTIGNKQPVNPVILDLNEFITNLESMIKNILSRQIDFKFTPAPALDNIKIDLRQMDQLLFNLVLNARDAMPQKGQFTIATENVLLTRDFCQNHPGLKSGAYVKLTIADTGVGIDEELKEKIFEPFFTTKEQGKGTGLGLAIVKVIVKQNNGLITIHSVKGAGTRFDIYFPALREEKNNPHH
jgi:PAS domain S-box-containing protein